MLIFFIIKSQETIILINEVRDHYSRLLSFWLHHLASFQFPLQILVLIRLKCPLIMEENQCFWSPIKSRCISVIREGLLCSFCWCICQMQETCFYHLAEKLNMGWYNVWSFVAINKDPLPGSKYSKVHFMQPFSCSFNRDFSWKSRFQSWEVTFCWPTCKNPSLVFLSQWDLLSYSAALSESFSFDHKTPLRWFRPCLLSGKVPLLLIRSACHWRSVLSDL